LAISSAVISTVLPTRPMPPILDIRNLIVRFPVFSGVLLRKAGEVRAVDDVSFSVAPGETLGLVGESGSGKTTVGRAIINILKPTSYSVEIAVQFHSNNPSGAVHLAHLTRNEMRPYRSDIQMIFQDPYSSLN